MKQILHHRSNGINRASEHVSLMALREVVPADQLRHLDWIEKRLRALWLDLEKATFAEVTG